MEPARHDILLVVSDQGRALTPKRTQVTYADFAAFTLDQVAANDYLGKTVGIYSKVCPKGATFTDGGCVNR
jgi:hypothetical protein